MAPLQQLERSVASAYRWEQTSTPMACAAHGGARSAPSALILCSPWRTRPARPHARHMSRRHYGCPLNRTPRADDGRPVPAGLLAHGSCTSPPPSRRLPGSGMWRRRSPLTVAGAAAALRQRSPRTAFPFHPLPTLASRQQEPSRGRIEAVRGRSCQQDARLRAQFDACLWHAATASHRASRASGSTVAHVQTPSYGAAQKAGRQVEQRAPRRARR